MKSALTPLCLLALMLTATTASAGTQVLFQTSLGDFIVELYDSTPITRDNFLTYVTSGSYDDVIFHRSVPGFVVQAGGYFLTGSGPEYTVDTLATNGTIVNEASPSRPNVTGTIAMAKSSDPDSASSQWFVNLADNAMLDNEKNSGGFTTFGDVVSGMDVVYAIADLSIYNFGGVFANLPLHDSYTTGEPMREDFVAIYSASVIPEPSTLALITIGLAGFCRRRRIKQ